MTDFNDWYAQQNPELDADIDVLFADERAAYEAGAASQARTLRDHFAGQALQYIPSDERAASFAYAAAESYQMADAMLEARKTTGEGEA